MNLSVADTILFFGGSMAITAVWLFRRDLLTKKDGRRILFVLCVVLALVGFGGCVLLFSGRPTRLHFLIFPICVLLFHDGLLSLFKKKFQRAPVDTMFTAAGSLEDRAFNIIFAVVSLSVPVIAGSYMERLADSTTTH